METYSGFVLETKGGFYEGGCVLEVKGYPYCIRPPSSGDGCVLEIPARNFNVLVTWEKVVGDVVDWYAVDSDKYASRSLSKGACKVDDVFNRGRIGINVTGGWTLRQASW